MLRLIQQCFLIICIGLVIGCSSTTDQKENESLLPEQTSIEIGVTEEGNIGYRSEESGAEPYSFVHNDQEFHIIPMYDQFLEYITHAREDEGNINRDRLYRETVLKPFRLSAWGSENRIVEGDQIAFKRSNNLEELEKFIHLLYENHEQYIEIIMESLMASSDILPGPETRIFLVPYNPDEYRAEHGVRGYAYKDGVIVIIIEPKSSVEYILPYVVAHEYHHVILREDYRLNRRAYDLLEDVVTEGKADTFAKMIYPDVDPPWIETLAEEERVWSMMKRVMEPDSILSIDFSVGDSTRRVPVWSNYRIGYQIMQDFIKHNPEITVQEWTTMWGTEILEKSRFEDRFK
ncbi:DUF2268 domain-containing protein [Bacillus horti]|uniref:Uncharacterized protein YjaZ n=1 Tax=Caldalkalibacillus horti TaxID=77523 RepID=A0ABT9VUW3_9BACI|nr:DUF2268 domain-containing putative Zn-dependent protease [Bacillus horti]MDQ0164782.1 uncharacterized protein YjaZ [Bacillus horti]